MENGFIIKTSRLNRNFSDKNRQKKSSKTDKAKNGYTRKRKSGSKRDLS